MTEKTARKIKLTVDDVEIDVEGEHVELAINAHDTHVELRIGRGAKEVERAAQNLEPMSSSGGPRELGTAAQSQELVVHDKSFAIKNGGTTIELTPVRAREEEQTPITRENIERIWSEYKQYRYTHLRLVANDEKYDLFGDIRSDGHVVFAIAGKNALKLAKALGLEEKLTPSGYIRIGRDHLVELLNKGVKAYAVRKAKRGEVMWLVKITYKNKTMELKMSYHNYYLTKRSNRGAINVIVHDASGRREAVLDFGLLADIRMGAPYCEECLERWLADALYDAGVEWHATIERLYIRIPRNLKNVIRQFYLK